MQMQQPEEGAFSYQHARQQKNAPDPQDVPISFLASPYGSDSIHVALPVPVGRSGGYWQTSTLPQKHSERVPSSVYSQAPWEEEANASPTTLMIRNIPQQYTRDELVIEWPNHGSYDFFYLPYKTYAFINFTSSMAAQAFKERWNKTWLPRFASRRPLNISCAQVQGMRANLLQLKKNRPWRLKLDEYQPLIFVHGIQTSTEETLAKLHA